ncbi:MAG: hypothetical protein AAGH60_02520 [Pseudomonadota bacterium]
MSAEGLELASAAERLARVLKTASFPEEIAIMNGFGPAWPALRAISQAGISAFGGEPVLPHEVLEDGSKAPCAYVGPPDRLHALCRSGYAKYFSHAVVSGAGMFPIVRRRAELLKVALIEALISPSFGPYALKLPGERAYYALDGVHVRVAKAGSDRSLNDGLIGEVLVRAPDEILWTRTGTLSAFEQVPHRLREPGLIGWLGPVDEKLHVGDTAISADAVAAVEAYDPSILDARVVLRAPMGEISDPTSLVLQVETEAGAWIEDDVAQRFYANTGLRPKVERVVPGRLPQTGRRFVLEPPAVKGRPQMPLARQLDAPV